MGALVVGEVGAIGVPSPSSRMVLGRASYLVADEIFVVLDVF